MKDEQEYMRGMKDCRDGVPHKSNQSEDYDNGYSDQYTLEQVNTELTNVNH